MDIPKNPSDFFFVTIFRKAPAFKQGIGINDYFDYLCVFF